MQWMTVAQVLEDLGVARSTWNRWLVTGKGPRVVRLPNGQLRIKRVWFEAWINDLELDAA